MRKFFTTLRSTLGLMWAVDRKFFLITGFLMIVGGIVPIASSFTAKFLIDAFIKATTNHVQTVSTVLLSILALQYLIRMISDFQGTYMYEYAQRIMKFKTENYIDYQLSSKISSLDAYYFEHPKTQDLIRKAGRSLDKIPQSLNNVFFFISFCTTLIVSILALIPYGWYLPVIVMLATVPRFRVRQNEVKIEWSAFSNSTPDGRRLQYVSRLMGDKDSVFEFRVFGARVQLLEKITRLQNKIFSAMTKPLASYTARTLIPTFTESVVILILVYLKLPLLLKGTITIGAMTFLTQMLSQAVGTSENVGNQIANISENNLYIDNYFYLMNLKPKVIEKDPGHVFETIRPPLIELHDVSFGYTEKTTVLKKLNFQIKPGEHVAIVGPNGAGKTTLVSLLLRFYDPNRGSITIDDFDLKDIKRAHWYKFISLLSQSFQKYSFTVSENIAIGDSEPDKEKIKQAAQMSGADEFIEKFPKKYDQQLGREFDGEELSVGQWQKLALARAFYEEAPVLILDEPTSAIDAEAEAEIFDNLNKVYKDKTVVFVSHRFSTVRHADKIIVLKNGEIAEEGTHETLTKADGIYARMFRKQAKGYID